MQSNIATLVEQHFRSTLPYWEQIYSHSTVYSRIYQERARRALAYLDSAGLPSKAAVLEVGCGGGVITMELAKKGLYISAIDCVADMLEKTRAKARETGFESQVVTRLGDVNSMPFDDATFEAAFVIGVSEWLNSLARPLREVFRVLKPGGYLIISADNNWPLNHVFDPLINPALKPIKGSVGKILRSAGLRRLQPRCRAYSLTGFDRELSASGFEKVASQTIGFGPFSLCNRKLLNEKTGWELHQSLQRLADKGFPLLRSAGLVYLVLARKSSRHYGEL
jgi:ubiquinone/menaquinone biosynthesis C-methylase UbiE